MKYAECIEASTRYFGGDDLAASVFVDKYALRDQDDDIVEAMPQAMHERIAREFARVEAAKFKEPLSYETILAALEGYKRIVCQGSPSYGIGNPYRLVSLSNCFVIEPPLDSYGGIFRTDEQLVQISKRRGGVGTDLSHLRPIGAATKNSSRTSTGIPSFMQRFSNSIREVGQDGRRGALMLTLSVHHPDVLEFARIKNDDTKVTGANISVRLTDEFLTAVRDGREYEQRWPVEGAKPVVSRMVDARTVWMDIIRNAWLRAEPGLLFWDRVISESPADCYGDFGFQTVSTNPCSELPISILDSCRLMFLNLVTYVRDPFTKDAAFNFDAFRQDAVLLQRLMDDLVDLEIEAVNRIIDKIASDPEPKDVKAREAALWRQVLAACARGRRTGSGITGLGDCLAMLGLAYGSDEAIAMTEDIYRTLKLGCYRSSVDMAKELGPFPCFDVKLEERNPFLLRIRDDDPALYEDMQKYGRRNIALLTTAPVGSLSTQTQTTSSIEPLFSLDAYTRRKKINHGDHETRVDFVDQSGDRWAEFRVYHKGVQRWMEVTGETDPTRSPYHGSTAHDIDWERRVLLQAAAQRHIDHAISSTINLPHDVTVDEVARVYETAWEAGCKGITVYRDGCRTGVLVKHKVGIPRTQAPKRPASLPCEVHTTTIKGVKYSVVVGVMEGDPYEVYAVDDPIKTKVGTVKKTKRGHYVLLDEDDEVVYENLVGDRPEEEETITRLTSTSLRHGVDMNFIVHQLEKVGGSMHGFAAGLARVLKKYVADGSPVHGEVCGQCGNTSLVREEGCQHCRNCGWSRC